MDAGSMLCPIPQSSLWRGLRPNPACRELVKHQAKPHIVLKLLGLSDVADTVVRLAPLHRFSTPC